VAVHREDGQCLIHVNAAVPERLRATRGPGASYSDVHPADRRCFWNVLTRHDAYAASPISSSAACSTRLGRAGAIASRGLASGSLREQMLFPRSAVACHCSPLRFDPDGNLLPCLDNLYRAP
jgi:hypothetical protein